MPNVCYLAEDKQELENFLSILPTHSSSGPWTFKKEVKGIKKYLMDGTFRTDMSELPHFDKSEGAVFKDRPLDLDAIKAQDAQHEEEKRRRLEGRPQSLGTSTEEENVAEDQKQQQNAPATRAIHGHALSGVINAPIDYVIEHFLDPSFNIDHDPRIRFQHHIAHDNTAYSNTTYVQWAAPSRFPPADDRHSILRTALFHELEPSNIEHYARLNHFITDRCPDKDLRHEMEVAFNERIDQTHAYPDKKGVELFNKSLKGSSVILFQSVAPEYADVAFRQLRDSHVDIQDEGTVEAVVFPKSGIFFRTLSTEDAGQPTPPGEGSTSKERQDFANSIPKDRTEVIMVLFSNMHWQKIWGEGPFVSASPLASMRDEIEKRWIEHVSQEDQVPPENRHLKHFLASPAPGDRENTPIPSGSEMKGFRDPTYVYVPPNPKDGIERMAKETA